MTLVDDGQQRPTTAQSTATSQKDRVRAAIATPQTSGPATAAEPAPEPPAAPVAGPETPDEPGITSAQSKKLHASFNELGVTDRDQRLAYAAQIVGRELASSKDLTKDEASKVIESLVDALTPADEPIEAVIVEDEPKPNLWEQEATA